MRARKGSWHKESMMEAQGGENIKTEEEAFVNQPQYHSRAGKENKGEII